MLSFLVLALAFLLAGCAARLPGSELAPAPTKDLPARFARCEIEGTTREFEVERVERKKNKVALFMGYTGERGEEGGQTIGLDYVRRFGRRWAANGFVDFAAGGIEAGVVGVGASFYPVEWLAVFAGPGIEWVEGESQGLVRAGVALEFEVAEGVLLGPAAYLDFLEDGQIAWIVGASLVHEF